MNDVAELKRFVLVHARAQGIPGREHQALLRRVENDDGDGPGSWVRAWVEAGEALERQGRFLDACRRYIMARFPYVDGPARQDALDRCLAAFDRWRDGNGIERLDVDLGGGRVRCWTTGLDGRDRRPLLLVMGGIVSVKEQWAPVLTQARRLGMAGVVAEMPGVGENTARYGPHSGRLLPRILDAVADRADTGRTYAVALSFSGHLALGCAAGDSRIRGVITVGAPVSGFFTDAAWQRRVPRITLDTLAHISGVSPGDVHAHLSGMALDGDRLAAVDVPVHYMASLRDEIIPASEAELLRRHVRGLRLVENDDVHGSPRHFVETRLWIVRSLLELDGTHRPQRAALGALLRARRARSRLAVARPTR
ncbi:alpha/beta fold hydrolase [Actinomadura sp. NEAU-AAG7]|uniref:alpha/beta fold hydrolase n=1 Tax=Actinomadura sp. NEAU-AAG7 TaxID=2839640 RepID=UPI001BE44CEB|nr:alpha/beta hydrolase [Actinomadura sp. NEAU-AAG7]MBT2212469.1 alpha/beta hydrolase [Actinomadura sp. NEAU-AAG7]